MFQKPNTPFYLKYRPQRLDDLRGQEHIKKTLKAAFENNKLSHAYLFVGPRGSGKTSTARILAKMVNCENQGNVILGSETTPESSKADSGQARMTMGVPCNKCSSCLSVTDGSNLDLIEIDAASNRGIEDIRSLREGIKLAPSSAKKKVYIIDEVHMLTTEAFNALLKTLEEPPQHAFFVLATTEGSKIPQTILSRSQKLDFKLASPKELTEALVNIIQKEKIDIEDEALKILVRRADGSFRDGVKLLDQVHSLGGKITAKILDESLKTTQFEDLIKLLQLLVEGDSKNALLQLSFQSENGVDSKSLSVSLMDLLRSIIFIKNDLGSSLVEPLYIEENYKLLLELSNRFQIGKIVSVLNILQKALEQLKFTSIPYLPLEVAVVEICGDQTDQKKSAEIRKDQIINKSESLERLDTPTFPTSLDTDKPTPAESSDIAKLNEKWTYVLETVRPYNFSLEALLRSIKINDCTQELVVMEVPYSFHQRILEAPKNREILESILSDILGRSIRVTTVLGERPQREVDIANVEMAADDEIIRIASEIFNSDSIN